ncbi:Hypothetical predicted protein [Mytilus galloprovincialis]|uniref:Uncharacterized protein n=1 Tax=Mytilus galloprovincialis TaxID=29158 RepID=A0A8B6FKG2_MYTGA|nr:Hypothetical predicted protein [Mytilus galloprovincialis]
MFAVQWKIASKPVIIGKEAVLVCRGYNCPSGDTKQWLGGKNYDLLCFDNQSKNISKYEMRSNGTDFELKIKSLNFSDLNCEYTCSCGFHQYTNMLKLDDNEVIYPPVVHDHSRADLQEEGKFQINVSMEVYPIPKCKISSKDNDLRLNITVIKRPEGELKMYEVVVQATIGADVVICGENITLDCKVRSIQYQHLLRGPYSCKDVEEHSNLQYYIVAGTILPLVLVLVIVIAVVTIKYRLGRNNVTDQRDEGRANYSALNGNKC